MPARSSRAARRYSALVREHAHALQIFVAARGDRRQPEHERRRAVTDRDQLAKSKRSPRKTRVVLTRERRPRGRPPRRRARADRASKPFDRHADR